MLTFDAAVYRASVKGITCQKALRGEYVFRKENPRQLAPCMRQRILRVYQNLKVYVIIFLLLDGGDEYFLHLKRVL